MTDIDLEEFEPPDRPDFRRVGKGTPYVVEPNGDKRIRYRRSSSAGKILDDETGLTDWKIRTIVAGCAQRPDLMAMVSTLDQTTDKKRIRDIAEECLVSGKGTERQTTGTAIHAMLDHIDLGHEWTPAPQFAEAVAAYQSMLETFGLVPVDVEVHCVNDAQRLAGTMDRRYRTTKLLVMPTGDTVPIGSVLAGDTKTGRSLEYAAGSYATQLAAYADSVRYDVETDEREPFDPPTFADWALIVHVVADEGRCDLYAVDLEAGRTGIGLAAQVYEWRRRSDLLMPIRIPLQLVGQAEAAEATARSRHPSNSGQQTPSDALRGDELPSPALLPPETSPEVLEAVRAWLRERITAIRTQGDAACDLLIRKWPYGVPGLKFGGQTEEQLDAIKSVVELVEATFSLSWERPDPRQEINMIRHPRHSFLAEFEGSVPYDVMRTLASFAHIIGDEATDADLRDLLDGTIRGMGFEAGIGAIASLGPFDTPDLVTTAQAIRSGQALLLQTEDDRPVVRIVTVTNMNEG